ncbi:hypothetical protein Rhopal_003957-T1 [Rhodotorula paludigena]|uniref:mitogen-activated protein kinase kinase n=1 Tax=Rhodotorula paludigena TaxID=86838 RepID=A0AAV5GL52_9BASI|nr:hypothetical protein Rhopal_003957-T1 [Rhodotorula paludigena]
MAESVHARDHAVDQATRQLEHVDLEHPDPASAPPPAPAPAQAHVDAQADAVKQQIDVEQPTAVLTDEAAAHVQSPTPREHAAPAGQPGASTSARRPPAPGAGGALKAGVRGTIGGAGGPLKMPPSLAAKMAAMTSRSSGSQTSVPTLRSAAPSSSSSSSSSIPSGVPPALAPRPPPRPPAGPTSAPPGAGATGRPAGAVAGSGQRAMGGMAARRKGPGAGLTLSQMGVSASESSPFASPSSSAQAQAPAPRAGGMAARRGLGMGMRLPGSSEGGAQKQGGDDEPPSPTRSRSGGDGQMGGTPFSNFRKIVDPSGRLNFAQKAVLHSDGVDFSSGASFKIKMDDFELFEELGKGNYGTVQKVLHRPTGVTMALKEIRLELDDSKLKTIITELDILHRATSNRIIEFYGAFFIESCVYYCMEFMDAGSLDFFAGCDVPEDVLARITRSMVEGLRFLKDELKIMHRDVKPTNALVNMKGEVKLCDFGVSGQLDRSLAKTNIGCQSYMAFRELEADKRCSFLPQQPERIKGESQGVVTSYSAASDVWSLGLTIIEVAIGHYPFPPETYSNVFAQLTAIVHGDPPTLPERYSPEAQDFVAQCLRKDARLRPSYQQLLEHPWLKGDVQRDVDMVGWVERGIAYRKENPKISVPALA